MSGLESLIDTARALGASEVQLMIGNSRVTIEVDSSAALPTEESNAAAYRAREASWRPTLAEWIRTPLPRKRPLFEHNTPPTAEPTPTLPPLLQPSE